jgi:hypothetical protein
MTLLLAAKLGIRSAHAHGKTGSHLHSAADRFCWLERQLREPGRTAFDLPWRCALHLFAYVENADLTGWSGGVHPYVLQPFGKLLTYPSPLERSHACGPRTVTRGCVFTIYLRFFGTSSVQVPWLLITCLLGFVGFT